MTYSVNCILLSDYVIIYIILSFTS